MFENRRYVIINASDLPLVDFTEVLETSGDTCRLSLDGRLTFVKYDGTIPDSVNSIPSKGRELTHSEILEVLAGEEWTEPYHDTEESA